jgi:hypothetical protein
MAVVAGPQFLGAVGGWVSPRGFFGGRWWVGGWVGIGDFLSFLRCGLAKKPNPGGGSTVSDQPHFLYDGVAFLTRVVFFSSSRMMTHKGSTVLMPPPNELIGRN